MKNAGVVLMLLVMTVVPAHAGFKITETDSAIIVEYTGTPDTATSDARGASTSAPDTKSVIVTDRFDRARIKTLTARIEEAKKAEDQLAKPAASETAEETAAREESRKLKRSEMDEAVAELRRITGLEPNVRLIGSDAVNHFRRRGVDLKRPVTPSN